VKPARTGSIANAVLLVVLSLACGAFIASANGWYEGRDFHCWWVAGRIVANGGDPYDAQQFVPEILAVPPSPELALLRCGQRLSYPPWTALALAPFGALPLSTAATLWASLAVMATVLGINWTWKLVGQGRIPWLLVAALVVCTEQFVRTMLEGQFATFIFALTAGAALSMRSEGRAAGGLATALLAIKPQTGVVFGAAAFGLAVIRRRWRFAGAAGAVGLALVGFSQLLRPGWLLDSVGSVTELSTSIMDRATIWNLAGSWTVAVIVIALLLAAVLVLIRAKGADDAELLGLAVAFGLVVAPYAWDADYVVLAIPWSMTIGNARQLRPLPRSLLTMSTVMVAAPLPWIMAAVATLRDTQSLSVLVPMITALLLALSIRWAPSPINEPRAAAA
jgi:Glycosyltransferase family 87